MLQHAKNLKVFLEGYGFSVFVCDQMDAGEQYRRAIAVNASGCQFFIPFMNTQWCNSAECGYEFNIALRHLLKKGRPFIMPLLLADFSVYEQFPDINGFLCNTNGWPVNEHNLNINTWQKILTVLQSRKAPLPLGTPATKISLLPPTTQVPFEGGTLLSDNLKAKIAEWLPQRRFSLLYKATRDGFDGKDFHSKCDNKGPTITIIQSKGGYLFGGFTSQSWEGNNVYKADPTSFIFTLTNPHSLPPTQYPIKPDKIQKAIQCYHSHCAVFGGSDIRINSASHQNTSSCTKFPYTFTNTTGKGNTTFTGAEYFTTAEVEVYVVL